MMLMLFLSSLCLIFYPYSNYIGFRLRTVGSSMASSNLFDLLALLFIHFLWLGLVRFSLLLCCFEQFIYYWFLKYKQLFVIIISQFIYYLFLKYKQVFVAFVVLCCTLYSFIIMTYYLLSWLIIVMMIDYCCDDWLCWPQRRLMVLCGNIDCIISQPRVIYHRHSQAIVVSVIE